MKLSLRKLAHVAAAGAMVLGVGAFDGLRVGPQAADAREANAIAGTYKSAIILANPGTVDANATITFVTSTGSSALAPPGLTKLVPAGKSVQIYVPSVDGLADGRYSVLVDSDQAITAIANVGADDTSTFTSYNGIATSDTGTTFYIPEAFKTYFSYTTNIIVQNAGSGVASVTITYKNADGLTRTTESATIASGASQTFDQGANANLPDRWTGSAIVTSDQAVAAMFLVSLDDATYGKQLSSGRGSKAGASKVYMPVAYNMYYGNMTGMLVQNVGTTATDVTVTYYRNDGTKIDQTQMASINPGSSAQFLQFDSGQASAPNRAVVRPDSNGACNLPTDATCGNNGFNGSAVIDAGTGSIIAVGNIQHLGRHRFETYNGFAASSATNKVTCPSVFDGYFRNDAALAIQNVGTADATVTIAYNGVVNGAPFAKNVDTVIRPGAVYTKYTGQGYLGGPADSSAVPASAVGFNGSATITAQSGAQIVAVVNQETVPNSGDVLQTYDCTNS